MASQDGLVLVYGATGQQGGPVARRLLEEGRRIRILTRNPDHAESLREAGAEIAVGDLEHPESLQAASEGADKVFFHVPLGFEIDVGTTYGRNAIDAARSAGIGLFVLDTSFPVPSEPTDVVANEIRRVVQEYLQSSGIPYIVIRPTFYIENYAGPFTAPEDIVQQGILRYPPLPRDMRVSWVSLEDVGALAVEALKRPELAGSVFDVGGPEALTGDDIAERFGAILERPITYTPFSLEQYEQMVNGFLGEPIGTHVVRQLRYYEQHRHLLNVSDDMQRVLGELPVHLTTFERCISKMPLFTSEQAGA